MEHQIYQKPTFLIGRIELPNIPFTGMKWKFQEKYEMEISGKRLILSDDEIERWFGLPKFSQEDRAIYFSLDRREQEIVYAQRSLHTKINFILQLGYFKAKSMFFVFDLHTVEEDAKYIFNNQFPQQVEFPRNDIPHRTRFFIQNKILELYNYRLCNQTTKVILQKKLPN